MTHVLLVEDDSRIRSIVEQGLQARAFLVSSAPDGETGLDMARNLDVELVLLDLILPGIGGIEVLNEIRTVLGLKDRMRERVVGQDHGLDAIAQRIQTSRANLSDPRRPLGVFMLVGPSGVGKTETAVVLADCVGT